MEKYLPYVTSVVCALISGLISCLITLKQAKNEIRKLKKTYQLDFEKYKKQDFYEMRKKTIFKALTLFDDYISWLTVGGKKPIRKQDCTNAKFTFLAREVYNELCVTIENQKLVELFNYVFFGKSNNFLGEVALFRKEARKELGLTEIEYPKETAFISQIRTKDLAKEEKKQKKLQAKN